MAQFICLLRFKIAPFAALFFAFLAGCSDGGLDPILGTPGITTAPTVIATSPIASTPAVTGVSANGPITATFSKPMASTTISAANFSLACPAGAPVAATLTYDDTTRTATLTPSAALPLGTTCIATITTAVQDSTGIALANNFVWSFTTSLLPDTTSPTVILTVPDAGAPAASINTKVAATFSEAMNPATLSGATVSLTNTSLGVAVPGTVSYSTTANTVTFTPTGGVLAPNSVFTATVTTGATDLAGNALAGNTAVFPATGNQVWSFTTGAAPDVVPPSVIAVSPLDASVGVCLTSTLSATFSEPLDAASVNSTTFLVTAAGVAVPGVVTYDAPSRMARFVPANAAGFAANTVLVATVKGGSAGVRDVAGNPLGADRTWSFTTGTQSCAAVQVPDTTSPTVILTVPDAGAPAASINTKVAATFSEAMNPATLSGATVSLTNTSLGVAVPGTVSYSTTANTVTFTPTGGVLAPNSVFTATVTTGATDLAGNALAGNTAVFPATGNQVWSFTTGAAPDVVPPSVIAVSPLDASVGVCLTSTLSATFSEPLDAASVNSTTFLVTAAGVAVPGVVTYDAPSRMARFVPANAAGFAANTVLVATVKGGSAGVRDVAGNPLGADRTWSVSTGVQVCLSATINLRSAAPFASLANTAVTNLGLNTIINGNVGTTASCGLVSGLHDASSVFTQTLLNAGTVNGSVVCALPLLGTSAVATQAAVDAQLAYNALVALPAGGDPGAGELGGLTLAPGVYTAAAGRFSVTSGDLILDAQGDSGAVWVFQSGLSLTVGLNTAPRRVLLINGAQARNVFWQVGGPARVGDGSTMVGTVIAQGSVTISSLGQTAQTRLTGRAFALGGPATAVTLVNTTIVAP